MHRCDATIGNSGSPIFIKNSKGTHNEWKLCGVNSFSALSLKSNGGYIFTRELVKFIENILNFESKSPQKISLKDLFEN